MLTDQLLHSGRRSNARKTLNRTSPWLALTFLVALILLALSALPSFFGEKAALTLGKDAWIAPEQAGQILTEAHIGVVSIKPGDKGFQITLSDENQQMAARQLLAEEAHDPASITLSMVPAAPQWLGRLGLSPIKLGLDLRGGVQFLMQVDTAPVFKAQGDALSGAIRQAIREKGLRSVAVLKDESKLAANPEAIKLSGAEKSIAELKSYLVRSYPQWQTESVDGALFLRLKDTERAAMVSQTLKENISIMRGRIQQLGITEAVVQRHGENRILVELPGVQDPVAAKRVIGATASLSFHELSESGNALQTVFGEGRIGLNPAPVLGGEHIADARSGSDEMGRPSVNIVLDTEGGKRISDFSRGHIGEPMATRYSEYRASAEGTVKDSRVISVATINSQLGNRFSITGLGSHEEAQELAMLLRAGSMTAPVTIQKERTIGPSLGAENIHNGFAALALGMGATLLFMALWYRRLGWVANVALLANLVMLLGLLALIPGAVLTLPGIAGLVLTVGMAVDTNVLIFERIRDKMKEGRSLALSIDKGFASAFGTIMDANLTTMITALVLYAIGNGPIQGFALTLGLGLITSMITGIFMSRLIINWVYGRDERKAVRI
ncbi:protein translocase subunit SecD [Shewanella zhangzhouensis]|uniref:protein translocase subunit SecD n=1 Tax=Shewanella zhangzhouensis TaxID=2864213 RepID=UPI001C65C95F|nr:protein translocase subunit SecD [Shewanella zhangzhouensis]QYK04164.1 protein translocase subunit SecD [Shewanella zhangzhouensis]